MTARQAVVPDVDTSVAPDNQTPARLLLSCIYPGVTRFPVESAPNAPTAATGRISGMGLFLFDKRGRRCPGGKGSDQKPATS